MERKVDTLMSEWMNEWPAHNLWVNNVKEDHTVFSFTIINTQDQAFIIYKHDSHDFGGGRKF